MEADIAMIYREVIAFDDDNSPTPENFMRSDDILPTPSSLTFGFHGVDTWLKSGDLPVGRDKPKMTPNPRIHHMSCLYLFVKLYFMDYIKDVVILETKKRLNSDMNLSEYFRVISCRLIMACCVDHSVRHLFFKDPITPQKGASICLNPIISGRHLENIT